jgi:hypothetical protein
VPNLTKGALIEVKSLASFYDFLNLLYSANYTQLNGIRNNKSSNSFDF